MPHVLGMASGGDPPDAVLLDAGGVVVLPDPERILGAFARAECPVGREVLENSVEEGWRPPPLLVSHREGRYYLEDGNHRYETLRRSGATHAWTILLFADEAERDQFLTGHSRGSDRPGMGTVPHH